MNEWQIWDEDNVNISSCDYNSMFLNMATLCGRI